MINNSSELKDAIKQLDNMYKIISKIDEEKLEEILLPIDKKMTQRYDKSNVNWVSEEIWDNRHNVRELTNQAFENQNRTGTEPQMLLQLIDDYYMLLKRSVK